MCMMRKRKNKVLSHTFFVFLLQTRECPQGHSTILNPLVCLIHAFTCLFVFWEVCFCIPGGVSSLENVFCRPGHPHTYRYTHPAGTSASECWLKRCCLVVCFKWWFLFIPSVSSMAAHCHQPNRNKCGALVKRQSCTACRSFDLHPVLGCFWINVLVRFWAEISSSTLVEC